jgi:hypothetical protein
MINILYLYKVYKYRDIIEFRWIGGEMNPANIITKVKAYNTLIKLINTNIITLDSNIVE